MGQHNCGNFFMKPLLKWLGCHPSAGLGVLSAEHTSAAGLDKMSLKSVADRLLATWRIPSDFQRLNIW